MQTIKASEFKAKCLDLKNEVNPTNEDEIITEKRENLLGLHQSQAVMHDDLIAPIGGAWEAG